ncbi:hypothetical protein ACUXAU_001656 [Staphylococcus caprae]
MSRILKLLFKEYFSTLTTNYLYFIAFSIFILQYYSIIFLINEFFYNSQLIILIFSMVCILMLVHYINVPQFFNTKEILILKYLPIKTLKIVYSKLLLYYMLAMSILLIMNLCLIVLKVFKKTQIDLISFNVTILFTISILALIISIFFRFKKSIILYNISFYIFILLLIILPILKNFDSIPYMYIILFIPIMILLFFLTTYLLVKGYYINEQNSNRRMYRGVKFLKNPYSQNEYWILFTNKYILFQFFINLIIPTICLVALTTFANLYQSYVTMLPYSINDMIPIVLTVLIINNNLVTTSFSREGKLGHYLNQLPINFKLLNLHKILINLFFSFTSFTVPIIISLFLYNVNLLSVIFFYTLILLIILIQLLVDHRLSYTSWEIMSDALKKNKFILINLAISNLLFSFELFINFKYHVLVLTTIFNLLLFIYFFIKFMKIKRY